MRRFALFVIVMFMLYPVEVSAQLNPQNPTATTRSYVPTIGNVTVTLGLDTSLPASWNGDDVTVNQQMRLDGPGRQVGVMTVQMTLHNFTGGQASLVGEGQSFSASIQPNAVDDVVAVSGVSWQTFSYFGQLTQGSVGFGRQLAYDVRSDGSTVGRISLSFELVDPTASETQVTISRDGNGAGSGSVIAHAEPLIDQFKQVTNLFAGFVTSKNGNPVQAGQIRAIAGSGNFSAQIAAVGEKGGYGFQGTPMIVAGIVGGPIDFYFGDYKLETAYLTSEGGVRKVDFVLPVVTSNVNFPDWDLDGVPDGKDLCPNSKSSAVDSNGCTCDQLVALKGGSCVYIVGKGPKWMPPVPPPPPKPECDKPNKCIAGQSPSFCTGNKTIISNCDECGCAEGFTCNPCPEGQECIKDGNCYKVVERIGLQCLKNKYHYGPGLNCTSLGPTWVDFFAKDPLHRTMGNFVNVKVDTGAFGGDSKGIKKQIYNNLGQQRVCIDAIDLGCVPTDTKCPGEVNMKEHFPEIGGALAQFMGHKTTSDLAGAMGAPMNMALSSLGATIGTYVAFSSAAGPVGLLVGAVIGAVIGLIGAFLSDVQISFSLNLQAVKESQLRVPYSCDALLLRANETCKPLINNGNSDTQIDVLFINDGYTDLEFENVTSTLINYNGNASGTRTEGLFSREPFKKNKGLFNIWTIAPNASNMTIGHLQDEFRPSQGNLPNLTDVVQLATHCPQRDFVFVISKNERYQSECSFEGTQPCYLSMKDEGFAGRQMLRLMGKALGRLSDEWVFEREKTERQDRILDLENVGASDAPNCQPNSMAARGKWNDKIGAVGGGQTVGLFEGCGGDCGSSCEHNYRPTYNSALRNWTQKCGGEGHCAQGPPFDPFFIVSEEALVVAMQQWGDTEKAADEEAANLTHPAPVGGSEGNESATPPMPASLEDMPQNTTQAVNTSSSLHNAEVKIEVFAYTPASVKVAKNDKVTWVNKDAVAHTVTGQGFGKNLAAGESYTFQFTKVGNFSYHCDLHPEMQGTVSVA